MTKSFNDLGLSEQVLHAVRELGYTTPSPVQQQAIPLVLEGNDVIAAAKTGTGKTAAFCLPCLNGLGHAKKGQGPLMLVVTPTRELASQIESVAKTIAKQTGHKVTCIVGGVSYDPQISALKKGCDILIATPGRLIDLMDRRAVSLNQVSTLVLDEADRMLDMGFLPDMKKIVGATPENRQTLLFSATIDAGIEKNMGALLKNPKFVEIAHKGETADSVEQYKLDVDHRQKYNTLIELLKAKGGTRIIVFARTRHRADTCCSKLRRAGFKADAIHSDRKQSQRKRSLEGFTSGKVDILVATDVLARGIDVSEVNYVVNLDLPTVAEDYVHRIGRTGRAGAEGFAVSFVSADAKKDMKAIEKFIGKQIPVFDTTGIDLDVSEEALAAKATRKAAKNDPELAEAAREFANQKRRRTRKPNQGANETGAKKARTDAPGGKKNGKRSRQGENPNTRNERRDQKSRSGESLKGDLRPGRAHRAAVKAAKTNPSKPSSSKKRNTTRNRRPSNSRA